MLKKILILAVSMAAVLSGCQTDQMGHNEFPPPDGRSMQQCMDTQVAAGARADAMLQVRHFSGAALNSLGETKLDLILTDQEFCTPAVIYLDIPDDNRRAGREQAVRDFLRDAGLGESEIRLERGPNPATLHPAAPELTHMARTESGADVSATPVKSPTGNDGSANDAAGASAPLFKQ